MTETSAPPVRDLHRLTQGWEIAVTAANAATSPSAIDPQHGWLPASVPGTATAAFRTAGLWTLENPWSLHDKDVWYRLVLNGSGEYRLRFDGIATFAEIWLDDNRVASSDNMFLPLDVKIELAGRNVLSVVCRSLGERLKSAKGKRARWRTAMIEEPRLRFVRTTLLGFMPGWCPPVDQVGLWKDVTLTPAAGNRLREVKLRAAWTPSDGGRLTVDFTLTDGHAPLLVCNGREAACQRQTGGRYRATLDVPDTQPWWPHTHGEPVLYPVAIVDGDKSYPLGNTGFRSLDVDRGSDGSSCVFRVNGEIVFMRGVCWTPPDLSDLAFDEKNYRSEFNLLREANVNMVRISGTMFYESELFYQLADEYGILVWQDMPLANFDYPFDDAGFRTTIRQEIEAFLSSTLASPSLAVLCGGSEIWQQAAMMGLPAESWRNASFWQEIETLLKAMRDDIVFIENSPSGGSLPFSVNAGVGHYYGVGAYLRPLDDVHRAGVRFASECLAFANVPEQVTLECALNVPAVHHPKWKERVPRDRGASWDFEDVRDHYASLLFGIDPARQRLENPARYLACARATSAAVMEATFAEWRTAQSTTAGGLVFFWKDLWPGAGWGVVDSLGRPKSAWYALKRAFQPVHLVFSDESVNGLYLHAINETGSTRKMTVTVTFLREGHLAVASGKTNLVLGERQTQCLAVTDILGTFFDTNYCYKFGPPAHDAAVAQLICADSGEVLAEAFHFPQDAQTALVNTGLNASVTYNDSIPTLIMRCERLACMVSISSENFRPSDSYFHLAPGREKRVLLHRTPGHQESDANVTISALNDRILLNIPCRI